MYALSVMIWTIVSILARCHKLFVPVEHFDKLDLLFDVTDYIPAITCLFID